MAVEVASIDLNVKTLELDEDPVTITEPTTYKMPLPYYCSAAVECTPNRQLVNALLEDLQCVIDKSLGSREVLQGQYNNLGTEFQSCQAELEACLKCKAELERKLQELQNEYQRLQFCLEEEVQARKNLEQIVCELRAQIARLEECLALAAAEKAALCAQNNQLTALVQSLEGKILDLESHKCALMREFTGIDGTRNRCSNLQNALAQCCEKVDCLQAEVLDLRGENNDLKLKLETCCFEKSKLARDMEMLQQKLADEIACFEAKISELKRRLELEEASKTTVCQKTNTLLAAHHEEMDNLKSQVDKYKAMFEAEKKAREDLQSKLRECEEEKRRVNKSSGR